MIATGGYDREIKLWDPSSGQSLKAIRYPDGQLNKLSFSPDGKYLAAAGYANVRLYDYTSGSPQPQGVVSFSEHKLNLTAVGFRADAKLVFTGSEDHTVRLWDLRHNKSVSQYQCNAAVNSAVLHPDQAHILIATQAGELRAWESAGGETMLLQSSAREAGGALRAVAGSPYGGECFAGGKNRGGWGGGREKTV
eukprot:TRINITY_DN7827_c0_g1_i1.p2 TRINITY_DN7827_c0_g1~~TRINITY_DN7827_c0_g1_i1.p2  ORF type:complete len:194 (-),score=31.48 TRINITY_DN7827_c0_g1_i1:8-589(-)